jgi:putative FmdB family regulatory protein
MPLFEFICDDCGTGFEELVMGERAVDCPKCGSDDVRKQFSTFGVGRAGASSSTTACGAAASAPT